MTDKEQAKQTLENVIAALPLQLTDEQKATVNDAIYDFVNQMLDAVAERYHVVSKY